MKFFPRLILLVLITVLFAACGSNDSTNNMDGIDISVEADEETLAVGETMLIVTLQDASGTGIDGATVHVHGDMDHEGMDTIDAETNESTDGKYHVPFTWSMGGGWIVTVTAQLPDNGGEISETFEYFVGAASDESIINQHNQNDD